MNTLPERSGMSVLGSKVLLLPNMLMVLIDILIRMIDDVNVVIQIRRQAEGSVPIVVY